MMARASKDGSGTGTIRVQAERLRGDPAPAKAGPISGFPVMPESEASGTGPGTTEGRPCWLEDDVKRAIGAAQEAGLRAYRVEIAPDGTISLVVGVEPDPETTAPTA